MNAEPHLTLGVYRRQDEMELGFQRDSPLAWGLHCLRRAALEEALTDVDGLSVISWGDTKDRERTHEFVELILAVQGLVAPVDFTPALMYVGDLLVKAAISQVVSEGVKRLLAQLGPRQAQKQINDFFIKVDGVTITYPPVPDGSDASIVVRLNDGREVTVKYGANEEEVAALDPP